ncbi:acetaldehyde dehydrogenase [Melghirimyces profundicolus]|uniref:Acetaldehyde dehydrogenase n=1 Tax=Melghirimyces profundicolus TaxID=1242148 RepID=A0A2T6C8K0_9BACL|nr:acetaldehyde dehydrogenase (acetylating) [Melghirimyces profundicolus]PTX64644.1 acetaldehyde dehydrogenase [Melghirimyces profundicolus]
MELDKDLLSLQEMRNAVERAKSAQKKLEAYSQEKIDAIIRAISEKSYQSAEVLAEMAVSETGRGVVEHKKVKNQFVSKDVYKSIQSTQTVGVIREDPENRIVEVASPFGVIAAVVPVTNPTSTAIYKTMIALKTRNAIVVSPHPSAARCTVETLKICAEAAVAAGAPEGTIGWVSRPTLEATQQLMKHPDVNLILATGGSGLVRAAYSSGKPAYGVGPGNVPAYIERSADVPRAVRQIIDSKSFDNGTVCASEQAILVDKNIKQMVLRELRNQGVYILNGEEKKKVEAVISPAGKGLNAQIVGLSAGKIAEMAGITVPGTCKVLLAEEDRIGKDVPFSIEKLSPILALYEVEDWKEASRLSIMLLDLGGKGHSFSIHSNDEEVIRNMALEIPVSRLLVNTGSTFGAIGATTELKPAMTLGCGSFGGNITSDNLTVQHLMNTKRLAYGTKETPQVREQTKVASRQPTREVEARSEGGEASGVGREEITRIVEQVLARMS